MKKTAFSLFFCVLMYTAGAQAPAGINYQTVLRNAQGDPLINTPQVVLYFDILDGSPAGNIVYSERHTVTTNALGIVNLQIGQGTPTLGTFGGIIWEINQKYLKTSIDIGNTGTIVPAGTIQLVSVPYALFATKSGSTTIVTNATLSGNGSGVNPLLLAPQGAATGQVLKWNGNTWVPQNDNNTIYTNGDGINIVGNQIINTGDTNPNDDLTTASNAGGDLSGPFSNLNINTNAVGSNEIADAAVNTAELANGAVNGVKIAQQGAATGQVLKWNGTTWAPQNDNGDTYINGAGINILGNQIINTGDTNPNDDLTTASNAGGDLSGPFSNLNIIANAVGSNEIADGAVNTAELANGAVTGVKIAQQGAATGQVLKWNGTTWAPQNDNGDTYTNGAGINILGNQIINTGDTNPNDDLTTASNAGGDLSGPFSNLNIIANAVGSNEIADGAVNTTELANGAVTGVKIAQQGAVIGQVLQFNGTTWGPASLPSVQGDNWGAQAAVTNASLSGDGSPANPLGIATQSANAGQVLQYNGTAWVPTTFIANGEVTGALDNLIVTELRGRPIGGMAPQDGEMFVYNGTTGEWESQALSGEVSGTWNNTIVTELRGRPIGGMGPQDGEMFVYNGTTGEWESHALSGEVTGSWNSTILTELRGRPIGGMGPQDGEMFVYNGTTGEWESHALSGDVTGAWNNTNVNGLSGQPIVGVPGAGQILSMNSTNTGFIYTNDGLTLPYNNVANFGSNIMFNIENTGNTAIGMQVTSNNETGIRGVTKRGATGFDQEALKNINATYQAGIVGESTSTGNTDGIGILGRSRNASNGFGVGGLFQGKWFGTVGVGSIISGSGIATAGVAGFAPNAAYGGYFTGSNGGSNSSRAGVYAFANGARFGALLEGGSSAGGGFAGNLSTGAALYARENSGSSWATFAEGDCFCGFFVNASTPIVQIDHPLHPQEQLLSHSLMESPDMKTVYDGAIITDANGLAQVQLPDYIEVLNEQFRYQLTVIGQFAQAIVAEKIKDNHFVIQTDKPNVEVSWQVTGIRKPNFVMADRPPVVMNKPSEQLGKYLYPEFFGQPQSMKSVIEPTDTQASPAEIRRPIILPDND